MTVKIPKNITAARLKLVLLASLVLALVAGIGVFYLGYSQLNKIALEAGERAATARQSETTIQRLEALRTELEDKQDIVVKARKVTADSQNYNYQDQLINDLTIYANRANLSIANISFASQSANAATTPSTPAAETSGDTPAAAPETPTESPASAGLKKATVDITLNNPVNYRDLLNFLHYIEQNATKLKVSKVSLTKSENENVTIDILNLEVNLR